MTEAGQLPQRSDSDRSRAVDIAAILAIWAASLIVVHPIGNFPLDDGWSYGLTVKRLIETGVYHPVDNFTLMTLISVALWGALFCLPFGFSFNALRCSSLTIGAAGIVGMYVLLRDLERPRWVAIVGALTLAFNPAYYALAMRFMTDVPFAALNILAALFLLRNLRTNSLSQLLIGSALTAAAVLCRQLALFVPIAFAVTCVVSLRSRQTASLVRAVVPLAVSVAAMAGFEQWMSGHGAMPTSYRQGRLLLDVALNGHALVDIARGCVSSVLFLGWFSLPIAAAVDLRGERRWLLFSRLAGVVFVVLSAIPLVKGEAWLMPRKGEVVTSAGIGPSTLYDVIPLRATHLPELPAAFWLGMTILCVVGGYRLIKALMPLQVSGLPNSIKAPQTFFLVGIGLYLAVTLALVGFTDRYLIPIVPFVIAAVSLHSPSRGRSRKVGGAIGAAAFVSLLLFGVIGTRDYFAWNRARWQALEDLRVARIAPSEIDGGFEFNGFHIDEQDERGRPYDQRLAFELKPDARFVLTFRQIDQLRIAKQYEYSHWLPPYRGSVLVLERDTADRR